jgi:dephospho-CoA kinase
LKIGLTGGIASGKSAAAAAFARLGVPVIDADCIAREVVQPGEPALAALIDAFGEDILGQDGRLNRPRLRERMFADTETRARVENILHPAIGATLKARLADCCAPYCLAMVPLLVETGFEREVDRVLVVDCSETQQLQRLMQRDGESEPHARRMLANQASRARRLASADDVIENVGSMAELEAKVGRLHQRYLQLAAHAR